MAKNGIAINVPASLGLSRAGLIWLPLPEQGIPVSWLSEQDSNRNLFRLALCEETNKFNRDVRALDVDRPDWSGVERWVASAVAVREAKEAALAAVQAAADAARPVVEAAIVNPGESALLLRKSPTDTYPWGGWDWSPAKVIGQTGYPATPWNALADALRTEAERRTRQAEIVWADEIAELSNTDLLAWGRSKQAHGNTEPKLPAETRARLDRLRTDATEAQQVANETAIRAALSTAPAHVIERYEAGYLSPDELEERLADAAFGTITMPLHVDLTDDDYTHSDECSEPEVKISSRAYDQADDRLDAEEWTLWVTVRDTLLAAGFEPQLRRVRIYCSDRSCSSDGEVERFCARITTQIGGVKIRRDYAVA